MVTDKMIEAFANSFWPTSSEIVIDRNSTYIRAALEAALSASDAEPVGHVSREDLADLQSGGCGIVMKLPQGEGEVPLFTAPPAVAVKAFNIDDLAQEIRRIDGENSLGAGSLAEALMPFIRSTLVSPADTSPVFTVAQIIEKIKDYGQDSLPTSEYRLACDDLVEAFEALAAAPKEASHE